MDKEILNGYTRQMGKINYKIFIFWEGKEILNGHTRKLEIQVDRINVGIYTQKTKL